MYALSQLPQLPRTILFYNGGAHLTCRGSESLEDLKHLEAQGVEGKNIRTSKAQIEGMMDKVVEGFERQLDKLFQPDAVDITSDIQVLEQMLQKDGLTDSEILWAEP